MNQRDGRAGQAQPETPKDRPDPQAAAGAAGPDPDAEGGVAGDGGLESIPLGRSAEEGVNASLDRPRLTPQTRTQREPGRGGAEP